MSNFKKSQMQKNLKFIYLHLIYLDIHSSFFATLKSWYITSSIILKINKILQVHYYHTY